MQCYSELNAWKYNFFGSTMSMYELTIRYEFLDEKKPTTLLPYFSREPNYRLRHIKFRKNSHFPLYILCCCVAFLLESMLENIDRKIGNDLSFLCCKMLSISWIFNRSLISISVESIIACSQSCSVRFHPTETSWWQEKAMKSDNTNYWHVFALSLDM